MEFPKLKLDNTVPSLMKKNILIATDLDRTLIANGLHPESPQARPLFDKIVAKPNVKLAYVSGRNLELVNDAIVVFSLPQPDFIVSDVGTAIWIKQEKDWKRLEDWDRTIAPGWAGRNGEEIADLLKNIQGIEKQESTRQGRFKSSYYWSANVNLPELVQNITGTLKNAGINVDIVCSIDETTNDRFLDVLPKGASKHGAVDFLRQRGGFTLDRVVFSGDSGNDMDVLGSPIPAVLVANATDTVRQDAVNLSQKNGCPASLYLAKGMHGMNGCYAAGILEGLVHFIPETREWLE